MSRELERRFRRARVPGEAAAMERARPVVAAAFAAREPVRRAPRPALLAAAAAVVVALVLAVTPRGEAVADWVRDLVRADAPTAGRAPALTALPAPGRLLVAGPSGAWIVERGGAARRLGPYEDAGWSPQGLFVITTRGRQLAAVEPGGAVRWTLARPGRVAQPRWSPSGYRVAYRAGRSLRVVAGDGTGDRLLAATAGSAAPAWRPGRRHLLAYASAAGAVVLRDVDSGRRLWRTRAGASPRALTWIDGGRTLAVLRGSAVRLLDAGGRERRAIALGGRVVTIAGYARGTLLAASMAGAAGRVLLLDAAASSPRPRTLLAAPGQVAEVVFSPDGRSVLAARPRADEWVFLPVRSGGQARAVAGIAARFDPAADRPRGAPRVTDWCCATAGG